MLMGVPSGPFNPARSINAATSSDGSCSGAIRGWWSSMSGRYDATATAMGSDIPEQHAHRCAVAGGDDGNRTHVQGFAGPCLNHSATSPADRPYRHALRAHIRAANIGGCMCPDQHPAVPVEHWWALGSS